MLPKISVREFPRESVCGFLFFVQPELMTAGKMLIKSTGNRIEATPAILVVTMLFVAGRIDTRCYA